MSVAPVRVVAGLGTTQTLAWASKMPKIAGFASTVGWPLSTFLVTHFGWRDACFARAGLNLLVGLPLNALLPSLQTAAPLAAVEPATPSSTSETGDSRLRATFPAACG